ncbi:MAG: putative lipid II flippase FtsW [Candidatus Aquicultorales bacterium]
MRKRSLSLSGARTLLLGSAAFLIVFGMIMVLNASSVHAYSVYGDAYYFLKRQLVWALFGLVFFAAASRVDHRLLVKHSLFFVAVTALALVLVHVPGIGQTSKGASRAIGFGAYSFQPSEPAKMAVLLYLASVLAANRKKLHDIRALAGPGFVILVLLGLVVVQPDLGTTILITASALTMFFLGGLRFRHVFGLAAAAGAAGTAFAFSEEYRRDRLLAFIDPTADPTGIGYQIRQSLIGLGSGGLTGVGLGMSRQKFFFLPESHTDFIFAIIGEELGLLGTLAVIGAFGVLVYSGLSIAFKSKEYTGKVLGAGITASIAGQALINLGAATSLLPVTGVPLPLVSFGGSSLIVTMALIGILVNISTGGRRARSTSSHESSNKRRRDGGARLPRARSIEEAGVR